MLFEFLLTHKKDSILCNWNPSVHSHNLSLRLSPFYFKKEKKKRNRIQPLLHGYEYGYHIGYDTDTEIL